MFNRLQYERRRPPLLGLYLMYHDEDILEAVTGTIAQSGIPNSASLGLLVVLRFRFSKAIHHVSA